jgi:hypothetical protein
LEGEFSSILRMSIFDGGAGFNILLQFKNKHPVKKAD